MSVELYNLGWLAVNAQRAYPLSETASRLDSSGTFRLPDSFAVALYLTLDVRSDPDPLAFFVSRVINTPGAVVVTVSHWDGAAATEFGTAVVTSSTHTEFAAYEFSVASGFGTSAGRLVVGSLAEMRTAPAGAFTFDQDAGRIDPDCVRPYLRGLTELVVSNGGDLSDPITGRVVLLAGTNMRLGVAVGPTETVVRFDAVSGEGLSVDCGCEDADALSPCVRTLSGVYPDSAGNIDVVGGDCIDVTTGEAVVRLSDTCAKPCCGSTELDRIMDDLERLATQQTSLTNFINRLETMITGFEMVILGSRLNDQGCDNPV